MQDKVEKKIQDLIQSPMSMSVLVLTNQISFRCLTNILYYTFHININVRNVVMIYC